MSTKHRIVPNGHFGPLSIKDLQTLFSVNCSTLNQREHTDISSSRFVWFHDAFPQRNRHNTVADFEGDFRTRIAGPSPSVCWPRSAQRIEQRACRSRNPEAGRDSPGVRVRPSRNIRTAGRSRLCTLPRTDTPDRVYQSWRIHP